jgi:gluconate 2-dehydrogenase gamma chain
MDFTRRDWILATSAIAAAQQHAHQAATSSTPARFEALDAAAAADIEALTARIIPSDDSPGAREAGVVYFIDRALSTFDSAQRAAYRKGLDEARSVRLRLFPQSSSIASLTTAQQIELIRAIERTEFFELLRAHTILGFFGSPAYGGNRGLAGWKLIGFEDRMSFEPPFGHYDAEAMKAGPK